MGAGAAGLATAVFAGRARPAMSIAVLDGAKKIGAKILISGGGRCNVTNTVVTEADFWGGSRHVVRRLLRSFSARRAADLFRELGVRLHEEEDGKLFPDTNSARSVLEALLAEAKRVGATLLPEHRVTELRRGAD
ncbi:MAG TPA: NAD(P)/FAD-dependent oxidoreductase, partial [Planctomycetota bacterium]|nr:NAD(P)/FAD-dependent oxidoreductase [Planctomycetota bacterium]